MRYSKSLILTVLCTTVIASFSFLWVLTTNAIALEDAPKCAMKRLKMVSKAASAYLNCHVKATKDGMRDPTCFARAGRMLEVKWAKNDAKFECMHEEPTQAERVLEHVRDFSERLLEDQDLGLDIVTPDPPRLVFFLPLCLSEADLTDPPAAVASSALWVNTGWPNQCMPPQGKKTDFLDSAASMAEDWDWFYQTEWATEGGPPHWTPYDNTWPQYTSQMAFGRKNWCKNAAWQAGLLGGWPEGRGSNEFCPTLSQSECNSQWSDCCEWQGTNVGECASIIGDDTCPGEAYLAVKNNLAGLFDLWLSTTLTNPTGRFVKSGGPWVLPSGTVVADGWDDLVDGSLQHAIDELADGSSVPFGAYAWTGTDSGGGGTGINCTNWHDPSGVATVGAPGTSAADWSNSGSSNCTWTPSFSGPPTVPGVYCFQQMGRPQCGDLPLPGPPGGITQIYPNRCSEGLCPSGYTCGELADGPGCGCRPG